jgi:hypothetical protein
MGTRPGLNVKYFVASPGRYDIDKMREECLTKQSGDNYYAPCNAELHFHKSDEECNDKCEFYQAKEESSGSISGS